MKEFATIAFDPERCRIELAELGQLLEDHESLEERGQILPFFQERPHLAAFIGTHHPNIIVRDRIAFEYDLFGDFACDLAIGDSSRRAYSFVEFEDAGPNSIFEPTGRRSTPEWSRRFEHGYSQVVDWFWKLDDLARTDDFEGRFGGRPIDYNGLLIVGRSKHLADRERRRLEWRRKNVVVNSRHVNCFTFDELYANLLLRLTGYDPPASVAPA